MDFWDKLLNAAKTALRVEVASLGDETDDAVVAGAAGSVSGKLRAISRDAGALAACIVGNRVQVDAALPTSVAAPVTEASAAVNAAEATVCAAVPTGGKRYDRITITCDNLYTFKVYGGDEDFSDIANGYLLFDSTRTGLAGQSGIAGDAPSPIDVSGFAFVSCVVTNGGGDASTITVKHRFFD